jgi:putative transposase
MPWRKTEPMEERLKLIADRLAGYSITELSVIYGVSRKTVYKWTERYDRLGQDGLKELCRAPVNHPNQTDEEIVDRLVEAKLLHMNWGPKKLLDFLNMRQPQIKWPAVCTAEKWLKRPRQGSTAAQEDPTIQSAFSGLRCAKQGLERRLQRPVQDR